MIKWKNDYNLKLTTPILSSEKVGNRLSGTIPPRIGQRNRLQMLHLGKLEVIFAFTLF